MLEGGNQEIARWLNEKAVDLCFCAAPDSKTSCDWLPLYQDEMVVWLPKDHPMANQTSYPVAMLSQEKFIHTLPNEDTDQDRLIVAEKLQLNERYTTRDGFTTYNMVEAGTRRERQSTADFTKVARCSCRSAIATGSLCVTWSGCAKL